jgi:hypothetical protein
LISFPELVSKCSLNVRLKKFVVVVVVVIPLWGGVEPGLLLYQSRMMMSVEQSVE